MVFIHDLWGVGRANERKMFSLIHCDVRRHTKLKSHHLWRNSTKKSFITMFRLIYRKEKAPKLVNYGREKSLSDVLMILCSTCRSMFCQPSFTVINSLFAKKGVNERKMKVFHAITLQQSYFSLPNWLWWQMDCVKHVYIAAPTIKVIANTLHRDDFHNQIHSLLRRSPLRN